MKNLITSFLVFHFSFFIFHSVSAQWGCSCLPEGITFTTQEQIDSFAINYPGCTEIQGDVTIGGSNETTGISNLNGLNVVTSIGGDLMICGNYYLTGLDGLESLTSIGGSFSTGVIPGIPHIHFIGSGNLVNIEALSNLTNIGGDLKIWGTGLSDLSGLEGLTSIPGDLQIGTYIEWPTIKAQAGGNSHLKNVDGIENIISVGGNIQLEFNDSLTNIASLNDNITIDTLIIRYNSSLSECAVQTVCNHLYQATGYSIIELNAPGCNSPEEVEEACMSHCLPEGIIFTTQAQIDNFQTNYPGCTEIEGNVTINGGDITDLIGLNTLTSIAMDFNIIGNDALASLTGLENLTSIGNFFKIEHNDALINLSGLNNLISCFFLGIRFNDELTSLTGLENLTTTGSYCNISHNNSLINLTGLDNLSSVWGSLYIGFNNALVDLTGLESLNNSQATIAIEDNNTLTSLTGLNYLTTTFGLHIAGNPMLTNLNGLESLTSIGPGGLGINYSYLISLAGLEGLNEVEGSLIIGQDIEGEGGNPSLTSLSGLQNLYSVGGTLMIALNSSLASLSGLDNIEAASITNLFINQNSSLSTCEVQCICEYLAEPNGTIGIHDNAPGCNSPEEVEEACLTGAEEFKVQSAKFKVEVFPNPTNEIVHLEYEIENPSPVEIQVFNALGEKVAVLSDGTLSEGKHQIIWNTADLPAGLYFCSVQAGGEVAMVKLIKR